MDRLLLYRETGGRTGRANLSPRLLHTRLNSHDSLVRRLINHKELECGGQSCGALSWSDCGQILAIASDDCALRLYNADQGIITHKFDPVRGL